jgi:hypothetical protein
MERGARISNGPWAGSKRQEPLCSPRPVDSGVASPTEKGIAMSLVESPSKPSRRKIDVSTADTLADDRLDGAVAIARFLGIKPEHKIYPKLAAGLIPHVREGDKYIGSKRRLTKHYTGE